MDRFRGRRYAPADPPEFLDHEGLELLLIAAGDETVEEDVDEGSSIDGEDFASPVPVGAASSDWED